MRDDRLVIALFRWKPAAIHGMVFTDGEIDRLSSLDGVIERGKQFDGPAGIFESDR